MIGLLKNIQKQLKIVHEVGMTVQKSTETRIYSRNDRKYDEYTQLLFSLFLTDDVYLYFLHSFIYYIIPIYCDIDIEAS